MGAAIFAGLLLDPEAQARPEIEVQNISSHPLGVLGVDRHTKVPRRKVLIPRNVPLPATGSGTFPTFRADQRNVAVDVIEGGDDSGQNSTRIGRCVVSGLPAGLPAGTRVKVTFAYATNGRLTVTAEMPAIQAQMTMVVERATGLSEDEIKQWRQWIDAGAVLEITADAQAAEPVLELDAGDYLDLESHDEPIPADEPAPAAAPRRRKGAGPGRAEPQRDAGSGLDDFFKELE